MQRVIHNRRIDPVTKEAALKTLRTLSLSSIVAIAALSFAAAAAQPVAHAAPKPEAVSAPADLSADATYVLPGIFKPGMSIDDLRKRFGASNVKVDELAGAEGETSHGIVLFADDPLRRAEIFPLDAETLRGIALIRVGGNKSRWHIDNGMHLGMTLTELVAANGKPVTFSGMGWDYGGHVLGWQGGRYERRKDDEVYRGVTLSYEGDVGDAVPLGDAEFRSDDKKYPQQGKRLFVGELTVSFEAAD